MNLLSSQQSLQNNGFVESVEIKKKMLESVSRTFCIFLYESLRRRMLSCDVSGDSAGKVLL